MGGAKPILMFSVFIFLCVFFFCFRNVSLDKVVKCDVVVSESCFMYLKKCGETIFLGGVLL